MSDITKSSVATWTSSHSIGTSSSTYSGSHIAGSNVESMLLAISAEQLSSMDEGALTTLLQNLQGLLSQIENIDGQDAKEMAELIKSKIQLIEQAMKDKAQTSSETTDYNTGGASYNNSDSNAAVASEELQGLIAAIVEQTINAMKDKNQEGTDAATLDATATERAQAAQKQQEAADAYYGKQAISDRKQLFKTDEYSAKSTQYPNGAEPAIRNQQPYSNLYSNSENNRLIFSDEDTKLQYGLLQQEGLNVLRSEIVAAHEFIPVTGDVDEDRKVFQKRFQQGEQSSIAVTSVSRLIELHRQIRNYVILAAERVLERTFPEVCNRTTINSLLNTIKEFVRKIFDENSNFFTNQDLIRVIDGAMDNNAGRSFSNLFRSITEAYGANLDASTASLMSVFEEDDTNVVDFLARALLISHAGQSVEISNLINNQTKVEFASAIYAYYIYEQCIAAFSTYVMRVASLDRIFESCFGIDLTTFKSGAETLNQFNTALHSLNTLNTSTSKDKFRNKIGVLRGTNSLDGTVAMQTNLNLFSLLNFFDSNYSIANLNLSGDDKVIVRNSALRFCLSGDMLTHFNMIRKVSVSDMVAELPIEQLIELKLDNATPHSLSHAGFYDILSFVANANDGGVDFLDKKINNKSIATSEAMAMLADDFILSSMHKGDNYPKGVFTLAELSSIDVTDTRHPLHMKMLYTTLLGISYTGSDLRPDPVEGQKFVAPSNFFNAVESPPLLLFGNLPLNLDPFATQLDANLQVLGEELGKKVAVSESKYDPSFYGQDYVSGYNLTKHIKSDLIEQEFQLPSGGGNTTTQNQALLRLTSALYSAKYSKVIPLFDNLSKVYTTYETAEQSTGVGDNNSPLGKMSAKHRIVDLMLEFTKDLKSLVADRTRLPLLAVFLNQGTTESSSTLQFETFLSFFWSFINSSNYRKYTFDESSSTVEGKNIHVVNNGTASESQKGEAFRSSRRVASNLALIYTERCIIKFLKESAGARLTTGTEPIISRSGNDEIGTYESLLTREDSLDTAVNGLSRSGLTLLGGTQTQTNVDITTSVQPDSVFDLSRSEIIDAFNVCFAGGSGKISNIINGVPTDPEVAYNNFGLFRLFENSFTAAVFNLSQDYNASVDGIMPGAEDFVRKSNIFRVDGDILEYSNLTSDNHDQNKYNGSFDIGGPLSLTMAQKGIVFYKWLQNFVLNNLTIGLDRNIEDRLIFRKFNTQIFGLIQGIEQACRSATQINSQGYTAENALSQIDQVVSQEYTTAFQNGFNAVADLFNQIDQRRTNISNTMTAFLNHADGLMQYTRNDLNNEMLKQLLPQNFKEELALKDFFTGQDRNEANKLLLTSNSLTPANVITSYARNFKNEGTLIPSNYRFKINKNRLMHKVFSEPGFGFLKSEKRGLKTILNVGVTSGMLDAMQKNAYQATGNPAYINSPFIAIEVHKMDHLNTASIYCPKIFVFNARAHILDCSLAENKDAVHLYNYTDNATFESILRTIQYYIFEPGGPGGMSLDTKVLVGPQPKLYMTNEILENHLINYLLKEYMQSTTSFDMNEETFLLTRNKNRKFEAEGKNKKIFQSVLDTMSTVYPQVVFDDQLRNEVFRLTNVIKQIVPFANETRYATCSHPKKFDRVFSLIVNEKDFILKSFPDIFTQSTNRNIGSRLERPETVDITKFNQAVSNSLTNVNRGGSATTSANSHNSSAQIQETLGDIYQRSSNSNSDLITQYAKSLNDNSPEVYNYSVSVTLLPEDFSNPKKGETTDEAETVPDNSLVEGRVAIPAAKT